MTMTSNYILCEDRELHYTEWGAGNAETVVLWHGLARNGRDFDELARHLSPRYRVLCPDTIGRGLSQWSPQPEAEYSLSFYGRLATAFVDQLKIDRLHWVGTSMGGMIGMVVAAGSLKTRIRRLVLNDIGPKTAQAAVDRIRGYAGGPPEFDRVSELEAYFRTVYKPFGRLSDAELRKLTETSLRRTATGRITPHYDPKIVLQLTHRPDDDAMWDLYDAITAPTLLLRGAESDLLEPAAAEEMTRRGPKATLVTVAGCGHAPALNVPEQLNLISDFLAG